MLWPKNSFLKPLLTFSHRHKINFSEKIYETVSGSGSSTNNYLDNSVKMILIIGAKSSAVSKALPLTFISNIKGIYMK